MIRLLLWVMGISMVGWLGWQEIKAQGADWLPIEHVRVEGTFQFIAKDKIKKVLQGQLINGLYNADIQQIQKSVNELPWVEKVKVKRVWPNTIEIKISEQTAVAKWKVDGLLNEQGEIFKPENIDKFSYLPMISGPLGREKELLEDLDELIITLNDQKMEVAEFIVSKRRAWQIKLRNNMQIKVGKKEPLQKIQRFLNTMGLIGDVQMNDVEIIDLRYPNGYALKWKQGIEEIDWKEIAKLRKL